jgi:hypothetical protein
MKRCAQSLFIFLLLGVIINVAVAWGCVWTNTRANFGRSDLLDWTAPWPAPVPQDWMGPATQAYRISDLGMDVAFLWGAYGNRGRPSQLVFWRAGIPCKSLSWRTLWEEPTGGGKSIAIAILPMSSIDWNGGLALSRASSNAKWPGPKRVPLRPIWPGFAINTVFYAAILWLLFAAPFAIRRRRRIKRGLCPACAYPVGDSAVCTECGTPRMMKPQGAC